MTGIRKIVPGDYILRASVQNRMMEDALTGSGLLADGSDFAGFATIPALTAEATARVAGDAANGVRLIGGSSTPVRIYGAAGAPSVVLGSLVIPGGTLTPDSVLELDLLCRFPTPTHGGRAVQVLLGGVSVAQAFPTASVGAISGKVVLYVLPDLSGLSTFSANINDVLSPGAAAGLAFGTRSGDITTLAIDLTVSQTLTIQLNPVNDDIAELTAWSLTNRGRTPTAQVAPPLSVAAWGDSLTQGSGSVGPFILATAATTTSGSNVLTGVGSTTGVLAGMLVTGPGIPADTAVVSTGAGTITMSRNATASATISAVVKAGSWSQQLMYASPGRPVANLGVAGQTSAQIAARVVADKVRGKLWTCVFWMGRNDVGSANLTTLVLANLAAAVGNLAAGTKYIVCTVLPAANETTGTTNNTAILALNAAIKAAYPNNYVDLFAALAINGDGTVLAAWRASNGATEVHLNDLGYAQVQAAVSAKLTAMGA